MLSRVVYCKKIHSEFGTNREKLEIYWEKSRGKNRKSGQIWNDNPYFTENNKKRLNYLEFCQEAKSSQVQDDFLKKKTPESGEKSQYSGP